MVPRGGGGSIRQVKFSTYVNRNGRPGVGGAGDSVGSKSLIRLRIEYLVG